LRSPLDLSGPCHAAEAIMPVRKKVNVGMVGYGFMGRAHSNAFGKVNQFFDIDYQPVLKAVCGRD
jgi:hypothetical protein